jgi:hypothetical protein
MELFLLRNVGYPGSLSIQVKTARNVTAARHRLAAQAADIGTDPRDHRWRHTSSNLALVEEAVKLVRDHGAEPASVAEMWQALRSSNDPSRAAIFEATQRNEPLRGKILCRHEAA